ncbi:hypothetical protein EZ449_08555 [Pedobacter frigidisoli]|uniref:Uncharacterized protein n=1 Tax=Pedobacter frigidisoli TaxID=2530455 RepID=A0A4R0P508_9SPHI|nr:hypothetical protein [Pedobacter frigidisoli]TCD10393.1 hypothetical protein EZ449_08555 [Pedobacter frigidisoli]
MITVSDNSPTSNLLEIKVGDEIQSDSRSGIVQEIEIQERDDYMMFLFALENKQQIIVRKIRQVC